MDTTNHKITIEYLKLIFVKSRKSRLEFEPEKELDAAFRYLSVMFNLSHIQCALLSVVFNFTIDEDLERVKTQRLIDFLHLEVESFFDVKNDLELLINRGFIKQKNEDRSDNLFNSSFTINQKLFDMLFRNEEIQFEKLYGLGYNFVQFCGHQYRVNNRKLLSHLSREDVLNSIIDNENKNDNLSQIQTMKSLGLDVKDRLVMYYLIHKYNEANETEVSAYTVGFDIFGPSKVLSFINRLKKKVTQLQVQGLVESVGENQIQLTTKTKELFLNDTISTVEEDSQSEVETTHYYIRYDAIPEKKLYFNSDIQRELSILQTLLQKENFSEYQKEMIRRGNKAEGISILFYGPSGTGKSSIVSALAKFNRLNILHADVSKLRDLYYGNSEKNIKMLFDEYEKINRESSNQTILLLNECDSMLMTRTTVIDDRHDMTEATMTNVLLEMLEKNSGIIIGITNLEQNLDPAFLRRFTFKIHIGNPDKNAVKYILKDKINFLEEREVEKIANQFQLTGGQIENISTKCIINRIITKSNPTISEVMDMCDDEKIKSNKWKEVY